MFRPRCEQTPFQQKSELGLLPFEPNFCGMCSTHFGLLVYVLFLCISDCGYYYMITAFIVSVRTDYLKQLYRLVPVICAGTFTVVILCVIYWTVNWVWEGKNCFWTLPYFINTGTKLQGSRCGALGWGTALQVGRSQFRFPTVSFEFFFDIILPAALWPWGWLSL